MPLHPIISRTEAPTLEQGVKWIKLSIKPQLRANGFYAVCEAFSAVGKAIAKFRVCKLPVEDREATRKQKLSAAVRELRDAELHKINKDGSRILAALMGKE